MKTESAWNHSKYIHTTRIEQANFSVLLRCLAPFEAIWAAWKNVSCVSPLGYERNQGRNISPTKANEALVTLCKS